MVVFQAVIAAALLAHLPSIGDDDYGTADDAFVLEDVDKSIVLYDVVSCEVPEVWLTFVTDEANKPVFVQLGVPVIDRLADYRPAVALLAPGLPDLELPFDLPAGVGGVRFDAADTDLPGDFYEPFTMTSSWIWYEGTVEVPEPGQGWVVAWDPSGRTGKLWVAIGTVEDFSSGIGVTFEEIWGYHETNGSEPEGEVVEEQCEAPGSDDQGGDEGGETGGDGGSEDRDGAGADELELEGCGCRVGEPVRDGLPGALGLALLGLLLRRRGVARRGGAKRDFLCKRLQS